MFELLSDWKTRNLFHKYTQRVFVNCQKKSYSHFHTFALLLNEYCSYTNNILKYYSSTLLGLVGGNVTRVLHYLKQKGKIIPAFPFERKIFLQKQIHLKSTTLVFNK